MDNKYYDYITGQGVIVPDTSVLLSDIQKRFKELFGENLDVSPTTSQGRLIELFTRSEVFTLQACCALSNMLNLNKANGFVLDDLGALFLISRKPATKTTTTVIMSGVAGTIIPEGTRIKSTDGYVFVNPNRAVIGDNGSVNVLYEAVDAGEIPASPSTLTIILDSVNGLETVNNPANANIGTEQESDAVFRNRIKTSLTLNAVSILSAIKSAIEQVSGVKSSYCYDNFTDVPVVIDSLSVPPHSLLAVVDGGDDTEIAKAIWLKKTIGTGYIAKTAEGYTVVEKEVVDENYGTSYTVRFARPVYSDVDVEITVRRQTYSGTDLETAVKNAVLNFASGNNPEVDGIKIGSALSPFEISSAVSSEIPDIFIETVKVGLHGQEVKPETLTFGNLHKANIISGNITVVIK